SGREIAYNDDFHFRPDPALACTIPEEGEYVAEIRDALYRGREDFTYRIKVVELAPERTQAGDAVAGPVAEVAASAGTDLPIAAAGAQPGAAAVATHRFSGRAGERIVAEVFARREGSPLDSVLTIVGPDGRELATNDDCEDKAAGLLTHQADSRV